MVVPANKVFSLALRLFTKPFVGFAKANFKKQTAHPQGVQWGIIALGRFQHEANAWVSCLAMNKRRSEVQVSPLTNDKAFDAGAEFAAESMVYGVLLAWGIYEIAAAQVESKAKEDALRVIVETIEMRIKEEQEKNRVLEQQIDALTDQTS